MRFSHSGQGTGKVKVVSLDLCATETPRKGKVISHLVRHAIGCSGPKFLNPQGS